MAITILDIKNRMGTDKVNDYLYDETSSQTVDQILALCLNSANLYIKALCNKENQTFLDTDEFINEAILLYSIGEVYDYSNDDETGEVPKNTAEKMLLNAWNVREDTTNKDGFPAIKVVQSKGRRRISDIDIWVDDEAE